MPAGALTARTSRRYMIAVSRARDVAASMSSAGPRIR
jgi:hypothetical protein